MTLLRKLLMPTLRGSCVGIKALLLAGIVGGMGWGGGSEPARAQTAAGGGPPRIVTSFYPMYIATLNVAQGVDGVEIHNLTPPHAGCLHDYQMTPHDRVRLNAAHLLIANGAGMEDFLDKVLPQIPTLRVVDASENLPLLRDPGATDPNPHVWLSVTLHIGQVSNIMTRLAQADPPRAAQYLANGAAYIVRLDRLRADLRAGLETLRAREIVTFHDAFAYFAREFGLRVVAVVAHAPTSGPSARDLSRTIEIIRKSGAAAIFTEPQYPDRAATVIARETALPIHTLDPAVTGPMQADAYIAIMRENLAELRRALGPKP